MTKSVSDIIVLLVLYIVIQIIQKCNKINSKKLLLEQIELL